MARVRKPPRRLCVGCRESREKRDLVRIVRTPEGQIELDATGKRSGRGVYICPRAECLHKAVKGHQLEKALETAIPEEVIRNLEERMVR